MIEEYFHGLFFSHVAFYCVCIYWVANIEYNHIAINCTVNFNLCVKFCL